MDLGIIYQIAQNVTKLHMDPYFDLAHYIITCLSMRDELSAGFSTDHFSRKHPLASWTSCMASIFAGSLLTNFLLGEPILHALHNQNQVMTATLVWYLIFFSPYETVYKFGNYLPIKTLIAGMKEIRRCHKVHSGVAQAAKLYPNNYLIMIIIATIKGNGSGFMKPIERLVRGVWTPDAYEFLSPSFSTKSCIAGAVIFIINQHNYWVWARAPPHEFVFLGITIFYVYFKLSSIVSKTNDPFVYIEHWFCAVFFEGRLWESLKRIEKNIDKKKN